MSWAGTSTALESITIKVAVEKTLAHIDYWKPSDTMVIGGRYQNAAIVVADQCFMNTARAVECDVNGRNGEGRR